MAIEIEEQERVMKDDVSELNLTGRARGILAGAGIVSVRRLRAMTNEELLRIPAMGRKSINEIREEIGRYMERKGSDMEKETSAAEERERCAKLLDEEAQRGRDALNLWGTSGPVFDPKAIQVGIEVLEYCASRIRALKDEE